MTIANPTGDELTAVAVLEDAGWRVELAASINVFSAVGPGNAQASARPVGAGLIQVLQQHRATLPAPERQAIATLIAAVEAG